MDGCRTSSKRTWDERSRWLLLVVGLGGLEPPASSLSGMRSNQLSYRPVNLEQLTWRNEPSRPGGQMTEAATFGGVVRPLAVLQLCQSEKNTPKAGRPV